MEKKHISPSITSILTILFLILLLNPLIVSNERVQSTSCTSSFLLIGPYLQQPTQTSIYLCWETDIPSQHSHVSWGHTPDCCNNIDINNSENNTFQSVLLSNLESGTLYYYKITVDSVATPVYTFHTVPDKRESIQFVVYGDTRGVWDNWYNTQLVAEAIDRQRPEFLLHSGDIVSNGREKQQWVDFFHASTCIHNATFYPVLGNHEQYSSLYDSYFLSNLENYWYSFDYGPVHFIGLESSAASRYNPKQFLFLLMDLLSNTQDHTIVFFHHPPYSSGKHGSVYELRILWGPLFELFHVDVVFSGHDHAYEHGKVGTVHYIVSAGGGAPLYPVSQSWWTVYSESTYHYCYVEANPSEIIVKTMNLNDEIIDTFTILA